MSNLVSPPRLRPVDCQLPMRWYFDPEIFALEKKLLFDAGSNYVGHELMVPEPGDYQTIGWMDHAKVLVRNSENAASGIQLLSNICRHRQSLMLEGRGNIENIVCPLHRWTYDLKGGLLGAPRFPESPCVKLQSTPLTRWNGLLFAGPGNPLEELADFGCSEDFDFSGYVLDRVETTDYATNWKTFVEVYLEVYHVDFLHAGLGNFAGESGWSSRGQLAAEQVAAEKQLATTYAAYVKQPIDVIARDPAALSTGRRIFASNCAMCHGSDARGAKGFPNLSDDKWQWGGAPEQILATVLDGRQAAMPPFAAALGSVANVTATAVYVQSLSGMTVDPALAGAGKATFSGICAACHGAEGKGNPILGSADLTDDYWLYGNRIEDIRGAIEKGHNGQMPAWRAQLGETRSRLVAAYVYSLSHPQK